MVSETDQGVLVAVATKNGVQIDQHFGHADAFNIYRISGQQVIPVEVRQVEHYCQGGYGDEDKRDVILRALADCAAVFVARVGDGPARQLLQAGIQPVDDYPHAGLEAALLDWHAQQSAK